MQYAPANKIGLILGSLLAAASILSCNYTDAGVHQPRAAIVDQLSLTIPNPGLAQRTAAALNENGYNVDYFSGEETDVNFYRNLPKGDYDLVVFRNHSTRLEITYPHGEAFDQVILFTNEPSVGVPVSNEGGVTIYNVPTEEYNRYGRYKDDIDAGRLALVAYSAEDLKSSEGERYFGISARFVADSMIGEFEDTVIIMMGCEGLLTESTAKAFIERGADAYVSWDESVTATHNDKATERLIHYLVSDGLELGEAVSMTSDEVGPDPFFASELKIYPKN